MSNFKTNINKLKQTKLYLKSVIISCDANLSLGDYYNIFHRLHTFSMPVLSQTILALTAYTFLEVLITVATDIIELLTI